MTYIGETFGHELAAAGLAGAPVSWSREGGVLYGDAITPAQRVKVDAVLASHNVIDGSKVAAQRDIDDAAEAARLRHITPGAGQAATYILKDQQARAYRAARYPAGVPLMVHAEARATGASAQAAADAIIAKADAWMALAAEIEQVRRTGKVAVVAAIYGADFESARIAALDALAAI